MINQFYRLRDQLKQWWRYKQPTSLQREVLGLHTDSIDTELTAARLASETSAEYVTANMRTTKNFARDYDFHEDIISELDPKLKSDGLVLEFGVATGRTLNHFARMLPEKTVYGFDVFSGLPEDWRSRFYQGAFAQRLPKVRKNCQLIVGLFGDTLPKFVDEHTSPVALLHVDCDLYSSTVTILKKLNRQLVPGTVIVFDEYLNYPGWELDEFRAWQEFCTINHVRYEYISRVSRHQQVALRITNRLDL